MIGVTNDMAADINAQLYGAGQIEYQNILQIDVLFQLIGIVRLFFFDTPNAAPEGFQFFSQYYRIHRSRLSFSILSRSGTKSAVFSK